jgi:mevalonate kinase
MLKIFSYSVLDPYFINYEHNFVFITTSKCSKKFQKNYADTTLVAPAAEAVLTEHGLVEWGTRLKKEVSDDKKFCEENPNKAKRINKLINKANQLIQKAQEEENQKKKASYLYKANDLLDGARIIHLRQVYKHETWATRYYLIHGY